MNTTWLILIMGFGVYGLRVSGLLLYRSAMLNRWGQSLQFVPIALLSALVTLNLTREGTEYVQIAAAAIAAAAARKTRKIWACIATGMLCYWALRLAIP